MRFGSWTGAYAFIAFAIVGVLPAHAACTLPPPVRQQMETARHGTPGFDPYNRGLTYYDFRCISEAVAEFEAAVQALEGIPARSTRENELLGLSRAALALVRAHTRLAAGDRAAASAMIDVATRTAPSIVKVYAALAATATLDAMAPEWARLEPVLETLSELGYWKAAQALARRRLARGDTSSAYLEQQLARAENVETAHALRIILADVWRASGRTLEAWLLVRSFEEAAGDEILDAELRVEFLRVAVAVARARAAAGDRDAATSVRVYEGALREVERR